MRMAAKPGESPGGKGSQEKIVFDFRLMLKTFTIRAKPTW